jgi:hypothetical protein
MPALRKLSLQADAAFDHPSSFVSFFGRSAKNILAIVVTTVYRDSVGLQDGRHTGAGITAP